MRVALDGLPLSRTLTGVGHYTVELSRHLALNFPEDEYSLLSPRRFISEVHAESSSFGSLKILRPTIVPVIHYWWQFRLPQYLRVNQIEVFHGTNFELPANANCATVVTVHDLSTLIYPDTHERKNVNRAERRLPGAVSSASMVICPTEAVRQEIKEVLKIPLDRVVAIHEATREGIKTHQPTDDGLGRKRFGIGEQFLLYVGTVEPRKNLLNLVRAFERVSSCHESLQLVIAGKKGWMIDELLSYVKQSPVKSRIIFTGYVSDDDLSELYSSCLAFIYLSRYEGFGLPPLEAMSCGAPVIASRIPSIEEVVDSAARLVNPDDVEEIGEAIAHTLNDSALRARMSAAGKERAAQFSWTRHAGKVREVYEQAIDRHARKGKG